MAWLHMPRAVIQSYAVNLPAVHAAETLSDIGAARIADAGRMKLGTARRAQRRLQRETENREERRPADLGKLAAAGIRVERR